MGISANTLFHFTNCADNLIKILRNGLKPRFCLEDNRFLADGYKDEHFYEAIPMVCFCDIPLSNVPEHMDFYGNYGIGFTKEWGIRNGINPLIYLSSGSDLRQNISYLSRAIVERQEHVGEEASMRDLGNFFDLAAFVKPISGQMYRNGNFVDKYFYDEREWRFVPKVGNYLDEEEYDSRLTYEEYKDRVILAAANDDLSNSSTLSFDLDDIKYIIVEKESEVIAMIKTLRKLKDKYTVQKIETAFSKIIVAGQIRVDF